MKKLPDLRPIGLPVEALHPDTVRECSLVTLRTTRGYLTGAEALELCEITERQRARAYAADLAHDRATEARSFPQNPNIHDD